MNLSYTLSDFVGLTEAEPDLETLDKEIRDASITIAFDGINASPSGYELMFRAALPQADIDKANAVIAAHAGVRDSTLDEDAAAVKPKDPRTGYEVIAVSPYAYSEEDSTHKGVLFLPTRGQVSFHDIQVTTEVFIQGAEDYQISNGITGDIVEFSIVDKDDVLGMFGAMGLTVGQDVLEVAKFLRTFHVEPGTHRGQVLGKTAGQVLPGLYMRIKYDSKPLDGMPDPGQIRMNMLLRWYEE